MTKNSKNPLFRILLLEGIHSSAVENLKKQGLEVTLESHSLKGEALIKRAKGFHALGIRAKTQVDALALESLPGLLAIGAFGVGTNHIDLECASLLGIPVFNAPYSNTRSVAELVISELIALSRHLVDVSNMTHKGTWQKTAAGKRELRGKTLGVVGYGHIGSQVSILAEAMGLRVIYYDIANKLPLGNAQSIDRLEDLLAEADFVTLHVPETAKTKKMIGKEQLSRMKTGSFLINTSRGAVVVVEDLAAALRDGKLAGAAIDVFPDEPESNSEKFRSELQGLKNVILTPHIGGSTEEAQNAIGQGVSESLIRYLRSGLTVGAVNFPNLEVPIDHGGRRLVIIHKNASGAMTEINDVLSKIGAKIKIQYLSAIGSIGYAVLDMEVSDSEQAVAQISKVESAIKIRAL